MADIVAKGGEFRYSKKEGTNDVETLLIKTYDQKEHLNKCKPKLFQADTSFGTQAEKFKLYILLYLSQYTGMWEVFALVFLASETKVNVKNGVTFFRNSLSYSLSPNDRFIFFTD